jgi:hypothetical protein
LVPRLHRLLVIAESTDALLGNLFELEDLGAKDVKGISEPVGAWAAVRQSYDGCPSAASRRHGPSTRPTPSWIGSGSSSATPMGRRSPTSISREIDRRAAGKAFKKHAHAVSELLGNKAVKSLYAKMTLPYRHAGAVIGKKGSADHPQTATRAWNSGRARCTSPIGPATTSFLVDEANHMITFSYVEQPYRPLGAYKALCKSGFALLPPEELATSPSSSNGSRMRMWRRG